MHETLLDIASNITEIKKTVQFQQNKINLLSDVHSYRQRKRQRYFIPKSLFALPFF